MTITNIITASAAAAVGVAASIIHQAEALDANHHRLRKLVADDLSMPANENIDNVGSTLVEEVEPKIQMKIEDVDAGILSSSKAGKSKGSKSKGSKDSKACPLDDVDGTFLLDEGFAGIVAANGPNQCYPSARPGNNKGYSCRGYRCNTSCDCFGTSSGVGCNIGGRRRCICSNSYYNSGARRGRRGACCEKNSDCRSNNCSYFSPYGDNRCA